ncbi:MAG: DNA translocase FtsK [Fimbriimonadaceae bacterium]
MRTPARKTAAGRAEVASPDHRRSDITGLASIALGVVLGAGLGLGRTGLIGDALTLTLANLAGKGAWAAPVMLVLVGLALLAGRAPRTVGRTAAGGAMLFLSVLGFLAQQRFGTFFDPEVVVESGGYLGASAAWLFSTLLGQAAGVGIAVLGMAGLVLCLDAPLRHALDPRRRFGNGDKPKTVKPIPAKAVAAQAVVAMPEDVPEATRPRPSLLKPKAEERKPAPVLDTAPVRSGFNLPPMSLLHEPISKSKRSQQEMQANVQTLESTLEQFGIDANVVEVATGPTITRYELQLGPGIKVNRITALGDNIAMNLAASHVRVEAPIPGKTAIGVEVPNAVRAMVTLRELCEDLEFHSQDLKLAVGLGCDVSGTHKYADLTKMPHMLVAGATNSGKSICLATIIMSLIVRHTPKEVRLVMIDPKRVELALFDGLPHLMCPVVKDIKEAPGVLRAVWREMDRRYDQFSEAGVRNIEGWNNKCDEDDKMPYIVVVIDELADLMIQAAAEVETSICRLAQLARATGIHLVIATQRPSVDVITGTIKNNIPSRTAFAVSSQIDSRTILDQAGAEKLIGKGDMLFLPIDQTKPVRIQGCYVSEKEIEDVCQFWRGQAKPHYVLNPVQIAIEEREATMQEEEDADPLWSEAVKFVVERRQASTSMLQRKFAIGFQRASRLLDMMEERGVVGQRDGPRPREILLDPGQVAVMLGHAEDLTAMPDGSRLDDE